MHLRKLSCCVEHPCVIRAIANIRRLIKRRQIRGSRECAESTAYLLRKVVETFGVGDITQLLEKVQGVGQSLSAASSRELAVGNVVKRVLGLIKGEVEEDREREGSNDGDSGSESHRQVAGGEVPKDASNATIHGSGPLRHRDLDEASVTEPRDMGHRSLLSGSHPTPTPSGIATTSNSMFSLLSHPVLSSGSSSPVPGITSHTNHSPLSTQALANLDAVKELRAEIVEGIEELLDEIRQADDQIAVYSLEHIHSNEVILTNSSSKTVQKFLLKAAAKRKFTVIYAESYPNDHELNYRNLIGKANPGTKASEHFVKALTGAGVTVILIPDSAVFALMARVNEVILDAYVTLADGSLVASSGSKIIAEAAKFCRTHLIVLCGVYKISPVHPFDVELLMENGDPSKIVSYEDGSFIGRVEMACPLFDYLPSGLVDLYVTNLGGHSPSSLYRIVGDHYRAEDMELNIAKTPS